MLENFTSSQKRLFLFAGIMVAVLVLVLLVIIFPAKKKIRNFKKELADIKDQIKQVESLLGKEVAIEDEVMSLSDKYQKIDSKFPSKEEDALRRLADLARRYNIELLSTKAGSKSSFLNDTRNPVEFEGRTCQELPVSLEVRSSYTDLIAYMEALKKSLPAYVMIDQLKIAKDGEGPARLKIMVKLMVYLLS